MNFSLKTYCDPEEKKSFGGTQVQVFQSCHQNERNQCVLGTRWPAGEVLYPSAIVLHHWNGTTLCIHLWILYELYWVNGIRQEQELTLPDEHLHHKLVAGRLWH